MATLGSESSRPSRMRHHRRSWMAHQLAACLTKVVRSTRASSGKQCARVSTEVVKHFLIVTGDPQRGRPRAIVITRALGQVRRWSGALASAGLASDSGLISSLRQPQMSIPSDGLHGLSPQQRAMLLRGGDSLSLFFASKTCMSGEPGRGPLSSVVLSSPLASRGRRCVPHRLRSNPRERRRSAT